jgi:superfamily II DNA or RNA helicase
MEIKERKRQKKGERPKVIGVESVTFYKRKHNDKAFRSVIGSKERDQGFIELYDLEVEDAHEYFANDALVHNCHMVSSLKGMYGYVLQRTLAPVRIGVTATMPYRDEAKFALEGLIGPKLGELTVKEGNEIGIIAKPEIQIIEILGGGGLETYTDYKKVYQEGIVNNILRNRNIIEEAKEQVQRGKSVLINVNRIEHGYRLEDLAKEMKLDCKFIHGAADEDTRDRIKKALDSKETMCVIASAIFKEGVNIRSLDTCINAAGQKSEIATLQALGRGLRTTKDKKTVLIIDFKDTGNKYLRRHFRARYAIYKKNGWINEEDEARYKEQAEARGRKQVEENNNLLRRLGF